MKKLAMLVTILGLACQAANAVEGLFKHFHNIAAMVSGAINYVCSTIMTTNSRTMVAA